MHHAFTGSTRKARQVNLSGRPASNPWANLPGSAKTSHAQAAINSTLTQAQADRYKRQHERDRLDASRKLQRSWRGHAARRRQKAEWRQEWDDSEQRRLEGTHDTTYEHVLDPAFAAPPYNTQNLLLSQMRLLNHLQEYKRQLLSHDLDTARVLLVRHELDTARVLFFANALRHSTDLLRTIKLNATWTHNFAIFGATAARHIRSIKSMSWNPKTEEAVKQLSLAISLIAKVVPEHMSTSSDLYMKVLRELTEVRVGPAAQGAGVETLVALSQEPRSQAYKFFIKEMMSDDNLSQDLSMLSKIASNLDQGALARALLGQLDSLSSTETHEYVTDVQRLWQLSYLIFMHRESATGHARADFDFIRVISVLLRLCSSAINHGIEGKPIPQFCQQNIGSIHQQESIQQAITKLSRASTVQEVGSHSTDFEVADRLADYALSIMNTFELQKRSVRQMLYQSSVQLSSGEITPTISYFWAIVSKTKVFQQIAKDDRKGMSVLTEAAPNEQQFGRPSGTNEQINRWSAEWRIILAFLELYNFALLLMDDEEFFSADESQAFGKSRAVTTQWRKGALPLSDVAILIMFLKHLAFTLYWNAAHLIDTNDYNDPDRLATLLGSPAPDRKMSSHAEHATPIKLAGNEVTHAYLKDLTTGVLRLLHERDSRRRFLGPNHFLMTDQVDLAGFIADVVTEEEKRHEMQDDDDDEGESIEMESTGVREEELETDAEGLVRSMFGIREPHAPRSYASQQAAKRERQKTQARKRRTTQLLAPRLEILRNLPFFIPFEMRVQIFRGFIYKDQIRRRDGFVDPETWRMHISTTQGRDLEGRSRGFDAVGRHHAEIHRHHVFEDAFEAYYPLGEGLKEPIQISFIDQFGAPEAGIDGGGVTKEFLISVTSEALDPNNLMPMFTENEQRYLFPNPTMAQETSEHFQGIGMKPGDKAHQYNMREFLRRYEFLGRVIGKCLYEGILIDVNFAGFFLLKWTLTGGTTSATTESAYHASINDIRDFDEAMYQGLLKLKNYTGDVEADFGLDFTVNDDLTLRDRQGREFQKTVTTLLRPNGTNIAVTNKTKYAYIDNIVRYRLQQQPALVTNAFLQGLGQIIQPMWLAMFNQKELQKLVGGDNSELDIADLRRNTQYGGLYVIGDDGLEHPTVELFWKALKDMDDADRRKVLKFVTSTPRAPLLGFGHLNPKFSIRDSSEDQTRLPSTSTCVNLLKLPRYGDLKTMKEKLLYAVNAGAGFDLS